MSRGFDTLRQIQRNFSPTILLGSWFNAFLTPQLLEYSIQSVTHGKDALGEVTIKVRFKDKSVIGHGASEDIIVASAKAYLNAINKVLSQTNPE